MRTRDDIAKDAGCTESEYKDNINVRIGLLLQDIARGNRPR